jgi:hypothetical protein
MSLYVNRDRVEPAASPARSARKVTDASGTAVQVLDNFAYGFAWLVLSPEHDGKDAHRLLAIFRMQCGYEVAVLIEFSFAAFDLPAEVLTLYDEGAEVVLVVRTVAETIIGEDVIYDLRS